MVFSKEQVQLSLLTTKKLMILFCKCKDKGGIWKIKFMFSKIQRFFVSAKQWFCNIKSAFYEIKLCMDDLSQCCILCTEKNGGLNFGIGTRSLRFFSPFLAKISPIFRHPIRSRCRFRWEYIGLMVWLRLHGMMGRDYLLCKFCRDICLILNNVCTKQDIENSFEMSVIGFSHIFLI